MADRFCSKISFTNLKYKMRSPPHLRFFRILSNHCRGPMFAFSKLSAPERLIARCLSALAALVGSTFLLSLAPGASENPSNFFEQRGAWAGVGPLVAHLLAGASALVQPLADHYTFFAGAGGALWSAHILGRARREGPLRLHKAADGAGLTFALGMAAAHLFEAPRIFANIATFPEVVYFLSSLALLLFPVSLGAIAFCEHNKAKLKDPLNESFFWTWLAAVALSVMFPLFSLYGYTKAQPGGGLAVLVLLGHLAFAWGTAFVSFLYLSMRNSNALPTLSELDAVGARSAASLSPDKPSGYEGPTALC